MFHPPRRSLRVLLAAGALLAAAVSARAQAAPPRPPNLILIFADDLGYADIGPFGAKGYATPHLDRVAAEGIKFTDFYAAAPLCTPSRAALLTGCYPQRVGLTRVLFPWDRVGLHPEETTLAELLRSRGYATACIGKWHLGQLPPHLPTRHGFDTYFGIPYSNDMSPDPRNNPSPGPYVYPPLPLVRNEITIDTEPDQSQLTARYTAEAVRFIEAHKDQPFFLYLPHTMPHVPLYASDPFMGKSPRGLYGDVIQELDDSVGQILTALQRLGLDNQTLLVFTSDNGPWAGKGEHAGSAGPLRGAKGQALEGGMRVPFLARFPGRILAGAVASEPATTLDLLPTFAHLAGAPLPDRPIDGQNIWPLLAGEPGAASPHDAIYYYTAHQLRAVRSGRWKLCVALPGMRKALDQPVLYDLATDLHEDHNVAADHPEVVARMMTLITRARRDLGDTLTQSRGAATRPALTLPAH